MVTNQHNKGHQPDHRHILTNVFHVDFRVYNAIFHYIYVIRKTLQVLGQLV